MEVIELDLVTSTNDELKKLAEKGAKAFTVVTAKHQKAGRGRHNRIWESSAGNLFISVLVEPKRGSPQLSLVAGLAVFASIRKFTGQEVKLKWPNDVLVNGRKIAGILLEKINDKVIVGVGINIVSSPDYATDLKKLGVNEVAKNMREVFLYNFQKYYDEFENKGFQGIRAEWLKNAAFIGEQITIKLPQGNITGNFEGISDSGEIQIDGQVILSGEILQL